MVSISPVLYKNYFVTLELGLKNIIKKKKRKAICNKKMPVKRRNNQKLPKSRNSKAAVSHDHKEKTELKSQIRRLKKEQNSFFYK